MPGTASSTAARARHVERPVVVIGAGLAGMASALTLARDGRPVVVLEATQDVGGCCSTTQSSGYTFNNGAIYIAAPSALRSSFRRLGLDFDVDVPTVAIARPHAAYLDSGTVVHVSDVETSHVEGHASNARTHQLRDGLRKLQQQWGPIYRVLMRDVLPHEPSVLRTLGKLWRYLPRMHGHADRLIASSFPDADLQAAIASTLLYTGLPPERLPATQIVGLLALLEEGFHVPRGGMGAISAVLRRELDRLSVPIRFGAQVQQVLVEDRRVGGVVLADGERIDARQVIASCSGFALVHRLLPPEAVPRRLATRAATSPLSHRGVSIQVGCSGASLPDAFIVNHVPPMAQQAVMHLSGPRAPRWLAYTNPGSVVPELAPPGSAIVELFAPATGVRSASEFTREMTDAVAAHYLDALRTRLPGLSIEVTRVLGPRDFECRRHLHEGALYGMAPGVTPEKFFPHASGIQGLYLSGQTTFPGYGVPSAIQSGILAAEALQHR